MQSCLYCRCTCDNCQIMDKNIEYRCCKEIPETDQKNMEVVGPEAEEFKTPPTCIVYHPGFSAVCLNKLVLQTAWPQYKQQYQEPYEGPDHKCKRHIAYRQLARWCWGYLGMHVRVVLPSCAVS